MNWTAGILAIVLMWIPCAIILFRLHKLNKQIDQEYKEKLEEIKKQYGV